MHVAGSTDPREDLAGPRFRDDPHATYACWRSEGPVRRVRLPHGEDAWLVTGYPEARTALTDPRLSKEPQDARLNSEASALDRHLLATDPPDHTRLRKLVEGAFTSRRISSLRPRIEEITDELLDAMGSVHDRVNLIDALAFPLPMKVVSELLGIPVTDQDSFRVWFGDLVADEGVIGPEREQASRVALARYIKDLISHRRDNPCDDLISGLIAARDSDDRLSEDELISMVFLLLFAGHETTVNLIGNGAYLLLSDPERWERLRADRALLPAAIEEFLRFESPVEMTSNRTATEDLQLGGQHIAAGDVVLVVLLAANRDPERFESPDEVRFDRPRNPHIAFGHGIHYCVGAPLARLEARIAFDRLLDRFPQLRLAVDPQALTWRPGLLTRGMHTLPVHT